MVVVRSWGRVVKADHHLVPLASRLSAVTVIGSSAPGVAFGNGRSYGDVCLNPGGTLWLTRGLDRFIAFDAETGRLTVEAGVLLRDIQRLVMPRGFILPVTPGTQLITVGGAIANDVHGKNHHRLGSFGDHVRRIRLVRTDGEIVDCGPEEHADWFAATIGGAGLTGVITEVEIDLQRVPGPWLETETLAYRSIDEFFRISDDSEAGWEHTVSWIDCVSGGDQRGIFMRGNPLDAGERKPPRPRNLPMPLTPPLSMVNRLTLRPFNIAYYHVNRWRAGRTINHYEPFFYPLDNILDWNRMYGPQGFYQYQSVVPRAVGREAVTEMLKAIARSGDGSFLAVLKTFGERRSRGMLGFPRPGVTLALDFPNKGDRTHRLFARLDAIVREAGGAIYLAKDGRQPRELFEASYPELDRFLPYRDSGITSALSRRLMGS